MKIFSVTSKSYLTLYRQQCNWIAPRLRKVVRTLLKSSMQGMCALRQNACISSITCMCRGTLMISGRDWPRIEEIVSVHCCLYWCIIFSSWGCTKPVNISYVLNTKEDIIIYIHFFLLLNTKEDILKIVGVLEVSAATSIFSKPMVTATVWLPTLFEIYYFVFSRNWCKWRQNSHFWWTIPLIPGENFV